MTTNGDVERQVIFDDSQQRLADMAYRAIHVLNNKPEDIVMVAVHVDDPSWTEIVDVLMPGHDWQPYDEEDNA